MIRTFQGEISLLCTIFTSSTNIGIFLKTTLKAKRNLLHALFPSRKIASRFPITTLLGEWNLCVIYFFLAQTTRIPTTISHCENNLANTIFSYSVNTSTLLIKLLQGERNIICAKFSFNKKKENITTLQGEWNIIRARFTSHTNKNLFPIITLQGKKSNAC